MNIKSGKRALAVLLSAATVAAVSMPATISSSLVAYAATAVDMTDVSTNSTLVATLNGVELNNSSLPKNKVITYTFVPSSYDRTKFMYSFKVYRPNADGNAATTSEAKTVAVQKSNSFTFKATGTGKYTVVATVVNNATGEVITKSFVISINTGSKITDNATVYDVDGNKYKVLSASNKTLALTGIIRSKSNKNVGYDFEEPTVSIVDTIGGVKIPMEGFKITQLGDGTNYVKPLIFDENGNATTTGALKFKEINVPSTVTVIKKNAISSALLNVKASGGPVVYLGSKNTNDLYGSALTTIEEDGFTSGVVSKVNIKTNHANVAGSSYTTNNSDNVIRVSNAYKFKYSWIKDLPSGVHFEAPFGSWAWTLAKLASDFNASKEDDTYKHADGYGVTERKNFVLTATKDSGLTKTLHDDTYNKDMMIAPLFTANKIYVNKAPEFNLVVQNGGNFGILPSGTAYAIESEIFFGNVLDAKNDNGVVSIYPFKQATTGLSNTDIWKCNIATAFNVGVGSTDSRIELVDLHKLGLLPSTTVTNLKGNATNIASYYGEATDANEKLLKDATTQFNVAIRFPVFKLKNSSGYIAFAGTRAFGTAYKKDSTGGEGVATIAFGTNSTKSLTKYNGTPYELNYYVSKKAELNNSDYVTVNNINLVRGAWVSKTVNGKSTKVFQTSSTGGFLRIDFDVNPNRYYKVEYVNMATDDENVVTVWNGAEKGIKGFDNVGSQAMTIKHSKNSNDFFEIRVTEYSGAFKGDGYCITARSTAYPMIDGRGFVKMYDANAKTSVEATDVADLNVTKTRYFKFFGDPAKSYRVYRYEKVGSEDIKSAGSAVLSSSVSDSACYDSFRVAGHGNLAIKYRALKYSTREVGVNTSVYYVVKEMKSAGSDASTDKAIAEPRVWVSTAKPVAAKNFKVDGVGVGNALKLLTFSARGVQMKVTNGTAGYFKYNSSNKACRVLGPVKNGDETYSHNTMKVNVNVSATGTTKVIDKNTMKIYYSPNFKTKKFNISNSDWIELPGSAGAFAGNTTTINIKPVNGLAFYRVGYNYVGESTVHYSNVVAVNYNALTEVYTKQLLKYEDTANAGTYVTTGKLKSYSNLSDAYIINKEYVSDTQIKEVETIKQSECFDPVSGKVKLATKVKGKDGTTDYIPVVVLANAARSFSKNSSTGKYSIDWAVVNVLSRAGSGVIKLTNDYSCTPATATFKPIMLTAKNNVIADGQSNTTFMRMVGTYDFATLRYTTNVYLLTTTGAGNTLKFTDAKLVSPGSTVDGLTVEASAEAMNMNGEFDVTLKSSTDAPKYIAVIQTIHERNPKTSTSDTGLGVMDGTRGPVTTKARVTFVKLSPASYTPIVSHKSSMKITKTNNTDELVVKVTGCTATGVANGSNNIFKYHYKENTSYKKLFNLRFAFMDDDDNPTKLTSADVKKLDAVFRVFNPSMVYITFKYTKNADKGTANEGKTYDARIEVKKPTYAAGSNLITEFGNKNTDSNSSRYLLTSGRLSGIEYCITSARILAYLEANDADMKAFGGAIKAKVKSTSASITAGTVSDGSYSTTVSARLGLSFASNVNIDVSAWK